MRAPRVILMLALLCANAFAQTARELDERARDPQLGPDEREVIIDRALRAYADVAAQTDDPLERARLRAAHVELLMYSVEHDGTLLRVLFGDPAPKHEASVRDAMERVAQIGAWASDDALRAIDASDRGAGRVLSDDERIEAVRLRATLLAMRRAQAHAVLAMIGKGGERRERAQEAIRLVGDAEASSAWARVQRWIIPGIAALAMDEHESARSLFQQAAEALSESDHVGELLDPLGPLIAFGYVASVQGGSGPAAASGALERVLREPPFVRQGERSLALDLVAADVGFRIDGRGSGDWRAAQQWYARLVDRSYPGATRAEVLDGVERRLAEVGASVPPEERLALTRVALLAERLNDADSRSDAIEALVRLAEEQGDGLARREARWHAAVGLLNRRWPGDGAQAMEMLLGYVRDNERPARERDALLLGCAAAAGALHDPATDAGGRALAMELLGIANARLEAGEPGDTWRLALLRVLAGREAPDIGEMLAVARATAPGTPARARAMLVCARMMRERDTPAREIADAASGAIAATRAARESAPGKPDAQLAHVEFGALLVRAEARLEAGDADGALEDTSALVRHLTRWRDLGIPPAGLAHAIALRIEARLAAQSASGMADEARALIEYVGDRAAALASERIARLVAERLDPLVAAYPVSDGAVTAPDELAALLDAAANHAEVDPALRAWALLLAGEHGEAAAAFGDLFESGGRTLMAMRGRAEALLGAGDAEGGFALYREIAEQTTETGSNAREHIIAWTRMLEVLVDRRGAAADTARIEREASRLLDAARTSCPACVTRLERVLSVVRRGG